MKITNKMNDKYTDFCNIDAGVVFRHNDFYFMKTMDIEDPTEDIFNAVNIQTGEHYYYQPYDVIELLNAELIIK